MLEVRRTHRRQWIVGAAVALAVGAIGACDREAAETPPAPTSTPESVPPTSTVAAIGAVSSWGNNGYAQLGDGTECDKPKPGDNCFRLAPGPVSGPGGSGQLSGVSSITAGGFHTVAVQPDRTVLSWGLNEEGQLGNGTYGPNSPVPVVVVGPGGTGKLDTATALGGGSVHNLAVARNGLAWAWGDNIWAQLGVGTSVGPQFCPRGSSVPAQGASMRPKTRRREVGQPETRQPEGDPATSCSQYPRAVLSPDGKGQLGNVVALVGGDNHSAALLGDGTVWTWGLNDEGQLGIGTSSGPEQCRPYSSYPAAGCSTKPVPVVGPGGTGRLSNIRALAAGSDFTLALRSDGTVWAWGSNAWNDLGQTDPTKMEKCKSPFAPVPEYCSTKPLQVVGPNGGFLTDIMAVSAEGAPLGLHAMALRRDGTVWSWGINDMGQLGNGKSELYRAAPVQVVGPGGKGFLTGIGAIGVGGKFSIALKTDGTVWAWGVNDQGQLGQNTRSGPQQCTDQNTPCSTTPVQVKGLRGQGLLTNVAAIAVGDDHVIAGQRP